MTEYEITDLAGMAFGNGMNAFTVFFSMVTAYLVVAHTAGKSFSTTQIAIVNVCYLLAVGFFGMFTIMFFRRGTQLAIEAAEITELQTLGAEQGTSYLGWLWVAIIIIVVITASFYFMWNVRHPMKK